MAKVTNTKKKKKISTNTVHVLEVVEGPRASSYDHRCQSHLGCQEGVFTFNAGLCDDM